MDTSKVKVHLTSHRWKSETKASNTRWHGSLFHDSRSSSDCDLNRLLPEENSSLDDWMSSLGHLNGFYAIVRQERYQTIAAVDQIRSIPIFYGQSNQVLFISDDADWVRQQVGDLELDPFASAEFQLTGYVLGNDTLFSNVKQLLAGQILIAEHHADTADTCNISLHSHYRFCHDAKADPDRHHLEQRFNDVLIATFTRLVDYAAGRQIVVPLSGGYDSRLIVSTLKRLNYDNILAFSYGVKGNKDSTYSRQVAQALGIKWLFIEYTGDKWSWIWNLKERWQYQKWASNMSSLAIDVDFLAVKIMKDQNLIDSDCIFVPGHCCVTGLIPDYVFQASSLTNRHLINDLQKRHFNLAPIEKLAPYNRAIMEKRIELSGIPKVSSFPEYIRAFMLYGWQERQAKYIGNSVRIYEFYNYSWWLPLWDREFMDFWRSVPPRFYQGRKLYIDFVQSRYESLSSMPASDKLGNASDRPLRSKVTRWVRELSFFNTQLGLRLLLSIQRYQSHKIQQSVARMGRYPASIRRHLTNKGYSSLGIRGYLLLQELNAYLQQEKD